MCLLTFEGEDASDLSFEGYAALIVNGFDVRLTIEVNHVYRGKSEENKSFKIGVVTPALVAEMIKGMIWGAK